MADEAERPVDINNIKAYLQSTGLLSAYEDLLHKIYAQGSPSMDVYEFAAQELSKMGTRPQPSKSKIGGPTPKKTDAADTPSKKKEAAAHAERTGSEKKKAKAIQPASIAKASPAAKPSAAKAKQPVTHDTNDDRTASAATDIQRVFRGKQTRKRMQSTDAPDVAVREKAETYKQVEDDHRSESPVLEEDENEDMLMAPTTDEAARGTPLPDDVAEDPEPLPLPVSAAVESSEETPSLVANPPGNENNGERSETNGVLPDPIAESAPDSAAVVAADEVAQIANPPAASIEPAAAADAETSSANTNDDSAIADSQAVAVESESAPVAAAVSSDVVGEPLVSSLSVDLSRLPQDAAPVLPNNAAAAAESGETSARSDRSAVRKQTTKAKVGNDSARNAPSHADSKVESATNSPRPVVKSQSSRVSEAKGSAPNSVQSTPRDPAESNQGSTSARSAKATPRQNTKKQSSSKDVQNAEAASK